MRVTKVKEHGTQRSDAVIFYVSGILPPRGRDFPFQNFWRLVHNTSVPDVKHWDVQRWRTSLWKSYRIIQNTAFLLLALHKLHDWLFTNQTGAVLLTIHSHSYLQVYTQICCRPCGAAERRRKKKRWNAQTGFTAETVFIPEIPLTYKLFSRVFWMFSYTML